MNNVGKGLEQIDMANTGKKIGKLINRQDLKDGVIWLSNSDISEMMDLNASGANSWKKAQEKQQ